MRKNEREREEIRAYQKEDGRNEEGNRSAPGDRKLSKDAGASRAEPHQSADLNGGPQLSNMPTEETKKKSFSIQFKIKTRKGVTRLFDSAGNRPRQLIAEQTQ